ncbi:glycine-rich domain-containing protein, partial [Phenylobacterium sp.]
MRGSPGLIAPRGLIAPPGLRGLIAPGAGRRRTGGVRVDYLVVGGGGGGGGDWFGPSGGGGGGGVIFAQDQGLAPGKYRIVVGIGGRGGAAAQYVRGEAGGASSIG